MEELLNKKITKIFISNDKRYIKFIDNQNQEFLYKIEYDEGCFVDSWIEHIHLPFAPSIEDGPEVVRIEEMPIMEVMPTLRECDELYCTKIFVKGKYGESFIGIEYRNSSNGYYGSNIIYLENGNEDNKDIVFKEVEESF